MKQDSFGRSKMKTATKDRTAVQCVPERRTIRTAPANALMSADPGADEKRDRWNSLISARLVAWEISTADMEEEDFIPPTPIAISMALAMARAWRDTGDPVPLDIVPDRDGG